MLLELISIAFCILIPILFIVRGNYRKVNEELNKQKASSDEIIAKQKEELEAVKYQLQQIRSQERQTEEKDTYIRALEKKTSELQKETVLMSNKNGALEKELSLTKQKRDKLENKLKQDKETLLQKIRNEYREQLESEGKLCSKNCVLCTILWCCQKKLDFYICGLQLMLTLFLHVAEKIPREYLKCDSFIEIFIKCGIIEELEGEVYEWSGDDESTKKSKIEKALNTITNIDDDIYLVGMKNPNAPGGGHCILCDVTTRDGNRTVMFIDPQRGGEGQMSKEQFREYLDDKDIVGIKFYSINLTKLEEIIREYEKILHYTSGQIQFAIQATV